LITGGNQYYPFGANGRDPQHPQVSIAELYIPNVLVSQPVLLSLPGQGSGPGAILHASTRQLASPDNPGVADGALGILPHGLTDGGVIPPQVTIGGLMANVLWFGASPGYVGLNQVSVLAPGGIARRPAVSVHLNAFDRPSSEVTIRVK